MKDPRIGTMPTGDSLEVIVPEHPIESKLREANEILLRILDSRESVTQECRETLLACTGNIHLEKLIDTAQEVANPQSPEQIRKLRSDVKSRIIESLKRVGMEMSLEGEKRKNSSDTRDMRTIRLDEELVSKFGNGIPRRVKNSKSN